MPPTSGASMTVLEIGEIGEEEEERGGGGGGGGG